MKNSDCDGQSFPCNYNEALRQDEKALASFRNILLNLNHEGKRQKLLFTDNLQSVRRKIHPEWKYHIQKKHLLTLVLL